MQKITEGYKMKYLSCDIAVKPICNGCCNKNTCCGSFPPPAINVKGYILKKQRDEHNAMRSNQKPGMQQHQKIQFRLLINQTNTKSLTILVVVTSEVLKAISSIQKRRRRESVSTVKFKQSTKF